MSWEELPIDIRCLILSYRYDARVDACKKIQNEWRQIINGEDAVIDIMLELDVDDNGMILTLWESNASILEFCHKKTSGKFNRDTWKILLESISDSLLYDKSWINQTNLIDTPNLKYYYMMDATYTELYNKFSIYDCYDNKSIKC